MSKYFLYVGNAYPHKNLPRLVEAVVMLNNTGSEKILLKIVCARSVFTKRLAKLIAALGGGKHVKILGFMEEAELGKLYKNSLAFVFPSLSEGFGLPGIEAMAAGTLLLASDIAVFREVYQDNALYFNPLKPSAIEAALREVVLMPNGQKEERILKARKFVKRYSWAKMAKETLVIYENCTRL